MNNLKSTKFIILFTVLAFLFGGVGMSMAQFTTPEDNFIETSTGVEATQLDEELDTINESIEMASNQLDSIDEVVLTQEEQVAIEREINIKVESLGVTSEDDVQIQMGELLRILQEKDTTRIQDVKREKLKRASTFLESQMEETEEGVEVEEIDTAADTLEEVFEELDEVEIITEKDIEELEKIVLEKKRKIIDRVTARKAFEDTLKDSDDDGISDFDEVTIYETDPFSADSDGDGYIDGAEVLSGFNPKDSSSDAIVIYENPKNTGVVEESLFSIGKIEIITRRDADSEMGATTASSVGKMLFEGQSLPNSFITLYIFSIPTVVTVKTDEDGNWSYTMDKELENGNHEIYVAMTGNSGKIITKSKPIPFVKEAFAVTVDDELLSLQIAGNKPSFLNFGYLYVTVLILVFLLGVILTIIGVRLNLRKEESSEDVY